MEKHDVHTDRKVKTLFTAVKQQYLYLRGEIVLSSEAASHYLMRVKGERVVVNIY